MERNLKRCGKNVVLVARTDVGIRYGDRYK